jgi:hypothetical protein
MHLGEGVSRGRNISRAFSNSFRSERPSARKIILKLFLYAALTLVKKQKILHALFLRII